MAQSSPGHTIIKSIPMVFDHLGFNVSDCPKARDLLVQALAPLDIAITSEGAGWALTRRSAAGLQ